ncbi:hypothetical protein [Deinococcus cellulosilyticus]|uniref:Uncharacterized protein n=1 Tax=Deinococcus cellulosilyticus (strain DSM 18568 / NBRC 106333 / KACC 11606 / 5516J-15) TaxID=1223518 RepID=A0A511N2W0_DEIC1|nr:hypothetical protein [Deinococcus cellulosilyticus]GEM47182.1 hypothetical protein DC3_28170 [Deinococcus cellulosilyticus NBRC 106333 = KACC 11606]
MIALWTLLWLFGLTVICAVRERRQEWLEQQQQIEAAAARNTSTLPTVPWSRGLQFRRWRR